MEDHRAVEVEVQEARGHGLADQIQRLGIVRAELARSEPGRDATVLEDQAAGGGRVGLGVQQDAIS